MSKPPGELPPPNQQAAPERPTPPVMPAPVDVGDLTGKTSVTATPRLKKQKYTADEARYIAAVVVAMGDEKTPGDVEKAMGILKSREKPDITAEIAKRYHDSREEYLDAKNQEREGHTEPITHDPYNRAVKQLKDGLRGDKLYAKYFGSFDPEKMKGKDVIPLWIDGYDDIFSDFDSSDFSRRQVSEDLVGQIRTTLKNGNGKPIALRFQIAGEHWNQETEEVVKARLTGHFEEEEKRVAKEIRSLRKRGGIGVTAALVLFSAYEAVEQFGPKGYMPQLGAQILDFAGFVLGFWGADQILIDSRPKYEQKHMFNRLKKAEVFFEQY